MKLGNLIESLNGGKMIDGGVVVRKGLLASLLVIFECSAGGSKDLVIRCNS